QMTDPVTLYEDPTTLFIAKFVGSPIINIFTKESRSINKEHSFYNKDWFHFGVRPEHLVVANEESHLLRDRKSTRLNSSHVSISYAVFCLKKKKKVKQNKSIINEQ